MSINKVNSNSVPRQLPVLTYVITMIQDMVSQGVNYWPDRMDMSASFPAQYPLVSSPNEHLQSDIGISNLDLWENLGNKIPKWMGELFKLGWPPQIIGLYYNFVLDAYRETASTVIENGYKGRQVEIEDISFTVSMKDAEKRMFGHSSTDFLEMSPRLEGQDVSLIDFFLSQINPVDSSLDITELKKCIKEGSEKHPDVITAIETAIKVQVIIETGKMMGILEQPN